MLAIGKRCANSDANTLVIGSTASTCTTSTPVCTCPSNPQWRSVRRRSWSGPTGQPSCHDAPRSVAVTGCAAASNVATAGAVVGGVAGLGATVGGSVGGAVTGTVDATVGGTVDGTTVLGGVRTPDVSSLDPPPHAASVASSAATATTRKALSPAARGGRRS